MNKPVVINSLSNISKNYDNFIIDQWGVIHNGKKAYNHALECIGRLYKDSKNLIIISNSSKKNDVTKERLKHLGFENKHFINLVTSGELILNEIRNPTLKWSKDLGKNCFHFSSSINETKECIKYINKNIVDDINYADFILGSTINLNMTIIDYVPILEIAIKKKIPFICANPDFESIEKDNKNKKIICMGTIAKLYENFGGISYYLGKPSDYIYNKAIKPIKKFNKMKTIAIGDSFFHDILGANNFGIKSIMITSGIHNDLFLSKKISWNKNLDNYFNSSIKPDFLCEKFSY